MSDEVCRALCAQPEDGLALGEWTWNGEFCTLKTAHFDMICLPEHNGCGGFATTSDVTDFIRLRNLNRLKEEQPTAEKAAGGSSPATNPRSPG